MLVCSVWCLSLICFPCHLFHDCPHQWISFLLQRIALELCGTATQVAFSKGSVCHWWLGCPLIAFSWGHHSILRPRASLWVSMSALLLSHGCVTALIVFPVYVASNGRIPVNTELEKGCGRKRWRPNSRYNLGICLEGPRKYRKYRWE
jgi:hypothetical protein